MNIELEILHGELVVRLIESDEEGRGCVLATSSVPLADLARELHNASIGKSEYEPTAFTRKSDTTKQRPQ